MHHHRLGLAALLVLALAVAQTSAAIIDFRDNGDFQAPSVSEGGVTVTGSNTLFVESGSSSGLSVVGGAADQLVDKKPVPLAVEEYLEFTADSPNLFTSFVFQTGSTTNLNGGLIDSFTITGTNASAATASFNYLGSGATLFHDDMVARLGIGPLKKIRATATGDAYRLGAIDVAGVPEPQSATLLLAAAAASRLRCRRKCRKCRTVAKS